MHLATFFSIINKQPVTANHWFYTLTDNLQACNPCKLNSSCKDACSNSRKSAAHTSSAHRKPNHLSYIVKQSDTHSREWPSVHHIPHLQHLMRQHSNVVQRLHYNNQHHDSCKSRRLFISITAPWPAGTASPHRWRLWG
jgi:hypothetical protein